MEFIIYLGSIIVCMLIANYFLNKGVQKRMDKLLEIAQDLQDMTTNLNVNIALLDEVAEKYEKCDQKWREHDETETTEANGDSGSG